MECVDSCSLLDYFCTFTGSMAPMINVLIHLRNSNLVTLLKNRCLDDVQRFYKTPTEQSSHLISSSWWILVCVSTVSVSQRRTSGFQWAAVINRCVAASLDHQGRLSQWLRCRSVYMSRSIFSDSTVVSRKPSEFSKQTDSRFKHLYVETNLLSGEQIHLYSSLSHSSPNWISCLFPSSLLKQFISVKVFNSIIVLTKAAWALRAGLIFMSHFPFSVRLWAEKSRDLMPTWRMCTVTGTGELGKNEACKMVVGWQMRLRAEQRNSGGKQIKLIRSKVEGGLGGYIGQMRHTLSQFLDWILQNLLFLPEYV